MESWICYPAHRPACTCNLPVPSMPMTRELLPGMHPVSISTARSAVSAHKELRNVGFAALAAVPSKVLQAPGSTVANKGCAVLQGCLPGI